MLIQMQINDGLMTKTRTYDKIYRGAGLAELTEQFFNHQAYSKWGQMVQLKGKEVIVLHRFGRVPDDVKPLTTPKIDVKMDEEMTGLLAQMQEIGNELAHQDNLGTAFPIWCVMEHKKVYVDYMQSWDSKERQDQDFFSPDDLCHTCRPLYDKGELPDDCEDDMCDESTFAYYNMEDVPSFWKGPAMFLTQKACQDHIDSCRYDYTDPRPYAYSAYNNYEMRSIIQFLIKLSGNEIPANHYR